MPLTLRSSEGGYVGLKFNPIYNAQWKETGAWEQSYHATARAGYRFTGWFDADGALLWDKPLWVDRYGESRVLTARFEKGSDPR